MWYICTPLEADIVNTSALRRGDEGFFLFAQMHTGSGVAQRSVHFQTDEYRLWKSHQHFVSSVIRPEFRTTFASTG